MWSNPGGEDPAGTGCDPAVTYQTCPPGRTPHSLQRGCGVGLLHLCLTTALDVDVVAHTHL
jgi:hypothetical protein